MGKDGIRGVVAGPILGPREGTGFSPLLLLSLLLLIIFIIIIVVGVVVVVVDDIKTSRT